MKLVRLLKHLCWICFKIALWLIGIFVLFNVAFIVYCTWAAYKPLTKKKFDSAAWKQVETGPRSPDNRLEDRCGMYHDLTRNHLRKGMTIKEVEALLGGPIEYWIYCSDKERKCAVYFLGVCFSALGSIVHTDLFTCFNRDGTLITYDRREHCKRRGSYNTRTKKQECFKTHSDGTSMPSNDCGIDDPW